MKFLIMFFSFCFVQAYSLSDNERLIYQDHLEYHHETGDMYYNQAEDACKCIDDQEAVNIGLTLFMNAQNLPKNTPCSHIVSEVIWGVETTCLSQYLTWWKIREKLAWAQYHYILMERYEKELKPFQPSYYYYKK
jgi:hypothetical protein